MDGQPSAVLLAEESKQKLFILEDALTRQVESMLVPQLAERLNLSSQEEFSKKPQQERMSNTFLLF